MKCPCCDGPHTLRGCMVLGRFRACPQPSDAAFIARCEAAGRAAWLKDYRCWVTAEMLREVGA